MEVHELLKKMRVDRGISQKKLAHGIVSRETLAKYENGKNHLPLLVFLELLERLNMTIDEFMFYLDGDKVSQKNLSLKKIFRNLEKNSGAINYQLKKLAQEVEYSDDLVVIRNYLAVKTYKWYEGIDGVKKLNKKDSNYLKRLSDYLEKIDEWGRFEMTTFATLIYLFETSYIKQRLKEVEKNVMKKGELESFHSILSGIYNNVFLLMIEREELKLAKYYLEKLCETRRRIIFQRETEIYHRFYQLVLAHIEGEAVSNKIKDFIMGLELIGANKLKNEFLTDLHRFETQYEIEHIFNI